LDSKICECVSAAGCAKYSQLLADIKKYEDELVKVKANAGTPEQIAKYEDVIAKLQANAEELKKYCLDNRNSLDETRVSQMVAYGGQVMGGLTLGQIDFSAGGLKPCLNKCNSAKWTQNPRTCVCSCSMPNCPVDQVSSTNLCDCVAFPKNADWVKSAQLLGSVQNQINGIQYGEGMDLGGYNTEMSTMRQKLSTVMNRIRDNIHDSGFDLQGAEKEIADISSEIELFSSKWETYRQTFVGKGPCFNGCPANNILPKGTCACYTNGDIQAYYSALSDMQQYENDIRSWSGGNAEERQAFIDEINSNRTAIASLRQLFIENSENLGAVQAEIDRKLGDYKSWWTTFPTRWDTYKTNNPTTTTTTTTTTTLAPTPCALTRCTNNQFFHKDSCSCKPMIAGFMSLEDLEQEVRNLRTEIETLKSHPSATEASVQTSLNTYLTQIEQFLQLISTTRDDIIRGMNAGEDPAGPNGYGTIAVDNINRIRTAMDGMRSQIVKIYGGTRASCNEDIKTKCAADGGNWTDLPECVCRFMV
jgi:hypothetical protein